MDVHLIQAGAVGRKEELLSGMAGQRRDRFQRYLDEVRGFVRLADEAGYAGYGHNEHHLQIEGFEATNHPGMFSQFVGNNSTRLRVNTLGYVAPTHNPVRAAEEIAMLDHILGGRLAVGFVRGYQDRWVANYAAVPGARATTPDNAKRKDEQDAINRAIFEEAVRIVKKAWTSPTFSYEGEFWTFPPKDLYQQHPIYDACGAGVGPDGHVTQIGIAPRPFQDPHPRLYGAFAHSLRTIRFWAREGGKPIVLANDLDFAEMLWGAYAEEAAAAGRDVPREEVAAWGGLLAISEDRRALDHQIEQHWWYYDEWFGPFAQGRPMPIMGTPDEVVRIITDAHARLGFNELHLLIGQGYQEREVVEENLRLFAEKVMPRLP
jgi:alkanesulfonate monooxygenase SsuD/methylene tetrahydromethanopterin reductase-like flavin-dependent oxidoreductase (luciferase family)